MAIWSISTPSGPRGRKRLCCQVSGYLRVPGRPHQIAGELMRVTPVERGEGIGIASGKQRGVGGSIGRDRVPVAFVDHR